MARPFPLLWLVDCHLCRYDMPLCSNGAFSVYQCCVSQAAFCDVIVGVLHCHTQISSQLRTSIRNRTLNLLRMAMHLFLSQAASCAQFPRVTLLTWDCCLRHRQPWSILDTWLDMVCLMHLRDICIVLAVSCVANTTAPNLPHTVCMHPIPT